MMSPACMNSCCHDSCMHALEEESCFIFHDVPCLSSGWRSAAARRSAPPQPRCNLALASRSALDLSAWSLPNGLIGCMGWNARLKVLLQSIFGKGQPGRSVPALAWPDAGHLRNGDPSLLGEELPRPMSVKLRPIGMLCGGSHAQPLPGLGGPMHAGRAGGWSLGRPRTVNATVKPSPEDTCARH